MKHCTLRLLVVSALALTGCVSSEKSENILSPTVAGPIPGISISAPDTVDPKNGLNVPVMEQPITLVLQNSQSSGPRPLSYAFEVATDTGFTNRVFVREGVVPGEGRTALRLPDALATGRTYYWRAKAKDGANESDFSAMAHFNVFTPVVIDRPIPIAPSGTAASLTPRFIVGNAPRTGPAGAIAYTVQLAMNDSFTALAAVWVVPEQAGETRLDAPSVLLPNTQYLWRVQAAAQSATGPWSNVLAFRTPLPIAIPPPTGGAPTNCGIAQSSVLQTLQCARNSYPSSMNSAQRGALMNYTAWVHRNEGWGMHLKPGGNRCPQPRTGTDISCDLLVHGPTQAVYDVLIDENYPTFLYKGPINTMSNFVAPVQP